MSHLRFCLIPRRLSINYDLNPDSVQSLRLHGQCALVAVFGEHTICSGIGTESINSHSVLFPHQLDGRGRHRERLKPECVLDLLPLAHSSIWIKSPEQFSFFWDPHLWAG